MIGVAAHEHHRPWVGEFFELFKTPWELFVPGRSYEVVLIADGRTDPRDARLALIYGVDQHPLDEQVGMLLQERRDSGELRWDKWDIPVYGPLAAFTGPHVDGVLTANSAAVSYVAKVHTTVIRRFAYDLFHEVSVLLSAGQPVERAHVPTLELHIAMMRQSLEAEGVAFLEIPPRPYGHAFVCCLTHDVDFFGIRRHTADRTLAGFVLRGLFGTAADTVLGRRPLNEAARNFGAVLALPLVFTGMARDFWHPFADYARADRGHPATFFLVPFKGRPGVSPQGVVEPTRAVAYGAADIASDIQNATTSRTEFAVHGIDAWREADAGRAELESVASVSAAVSAASGAGIRMHWLYYDPDTPAQLEQAGFTYDSTWGYNDAVGYKAGTMQAFQLPGTRSLMELPMSIMDTAMLYPGRMALSRDEANQRTSKVVDDARTFGGALVVNWHDRSLAPERQWGACYDHLLDEIEGESVWFATAGGAAEWFRWRRSVRFDGGGDRGRRVTVSAPHLPAGMPPARLTVRGHGTIHETAFDGGAGSVAL